MQVTIVPNPERVPALNGMDWLIRIENAATGAKFEVSDTSAKLVLTRPMQKYFFGRVAGVTVCYCQSQYVG